YAAEHDCIRYDSRGAGRSQVPWWPTSVPELAADAVRVLDALGVDSAHPVDAGPPLRGLSARAEPVTRHLGLQVGALRTARSLVTPPGLGRSRGRRAG
ncbi:MAG TPA: hypothetical protein VNU26_16830, partial [Mycobacteriales bacterium]|nr:hypothetical protein [Mycobacteriales bacterium]